VGRAGHGPARLALDRGSWSAWPGTLRVIGDRPISRRLAIAGWTVTVVVGGLGLLCVIPV